MNAFKTYLLETGQSAKEFAAKAGISEDAVYKYASGERRPRPNALQKIIKASESKLNWETFYSFIECTAAHQGSSHDIPSNIN